MYVCINPGAHPTITSYNSNVVKITTQLTAYIHNAVLLFSSDLKDTPSYYVCTMLAL
jgi:hypothetical protein